MTDVNNYCESLNGENDITPEKCNAEVEGIQVCGWVDSSSSCASNQDDVSNYCESLNGENDITPEKCNAEVEGIQVCKWQ